CLGKFGLRKPLTFPVNETFTPQWRNVPALSPNMGWGARAVDLMRTVGWACSLLVVLALALFAYSSRTIKHHAGAGSPIYPGNGPLPRGGGRYVVGQPYQVDGRWYSPAEQPEYDEIGVASWYGPQFHRRQTANGEWFDMDYLTAAHTTLPLPSYVRVT